MKVLQPDIMLQLDGWIKNILTDYCPEWR